MNYWDKKLVREQLSKKLQKLKALLQLPVPKGGWIKNIRESLDMTTYDLADRAGLNQSRISRIEAAEVKGKIKLSTLEKIADALGMKFVYAFIPKQDLETMVREQAKKIARERMNRVNHSMKLENQELDEKDRQKALNDLTDKIMVEEPTKFWGK